MRRSFLGSILLVLSLYPGLFSGRVAAEESRLRVLPGPLPGTLIKVIDGDTYIVRIHTWLDQMVEANVRLGGVNTPEAGSRACETERRLGLKAAAFIRERFEGRSVVLTDIRYGKWAGRVVASLADADGNSLADLLIREGLGVGYDGRSRRGDWCSGQYSPPS
ncbi:MAG: thermonuclease family protein [Rhodospirillales bacterium]